MYFQNSMIEKSAMWFPVNMTSFVLTKFQNRMMLISSFGMRIMKMQLKSAETINFLRRLHFQSGFKLSQVGQ